MRISDKIRKIAFKTALGFALGSALIPLNFNNKVPLEDKKPIHTSVLMAEENKEPSYPLHIDNDITGIMYVSKETLDSAFTWKYGTVTEMTDSMFKWIDQDISVEYPVLAFSGGEESYYLGDGWKVEITGSGHGSVYYNNEYYEASFWMGEYIPEHVRIHKVLEGLESGDIRFIKYRDKEGRNALVVKIYRDDLRFFYAGIGSGASLRVAPSQNTPYEIGDIGFLPDDSGSVLFGLLIEVNKRDDNGNKEECGIFGIIADPSPQHPAYRGRYLVRINNR